MNHPRFYFPLLTPFTLKNQIDFGALSRQIDFAQAAGAESLLVNTHQGEMYSLSEEERIALVKHVVDYVDGALPVMATGSFGYSLYDKAEFSKRLQQAGVQTVLWVNGHLANVEDEEQVLQEHLQKLMQLTPGVPFGLYECPAPYRRQVSASLFGQLMQDSRFVAYYDLSAQAATTQEKTVLLRSDFQYLIGYLPQQTDLLKPAGSGLCVTAAQFYPELVRALTKGGHQADGLLAQLQRTDEALQNAYPQSAKYFLRQRGLPIRTISRSYAQELSPEEKATLDGVMNLMQQWMKELGVNPVDVQETLMPKGRLDPAF